MNFLKKGASARTRFLFISAFSLCVGIAATPSPSPLQLSPKEVLAKAAEKGTAVAAALCAYSHYIEIKLETVSQADTITGQYTRFSQITYDSAGQRQEKLFEEKSTLPEDIHVGTNSAYNLIRVYTFIVVPESFKAYDFQYIGREKIDELNTYVFDVSPLIRLPNPQKSNERYLKGRIWIDDQDFQVVKVAGNAVPEPYEHRTPKFESYYQNHEQYWFPAFTTADDDVRVGKRTQRVMVKVRFTGYKKIA